MHGFIKRFANGVFYPEEVQILVAAFDDAWAKLQSSHAPFAEEAYASSRTGNSREAYHHGGYERRA
jgi:hypothetical protein